jgi:hypothetical protein
MEDGITMVSSAIADPADQPEVAALLAERVQSQCECECTVALTAPSLIPILPYHTTESLAVEASSPSCDHTGEAIFRKAGMTLLLGCLAKPTVEDLLRLAKDRIAWCDRGLAERGLDLADDKDFMFREVASRGANRGRKA